MLGLLLKFVALCCGLPLVQYACKCPCTTLTALDCQQNCFAVSSSLLLLLLLLRLRLVVVSCIFSFLFFCIFWFVALHSEVTAAAADAAQLAKGHATVIKFLHLHGKVSSS